MKTNIKQLGFTLVELIIVIAIVGILSTIVIPLYHDYAVRARVTEGLSLASSAKAAVEASFHSGNGVLPSSATSAVWVAPTGTNIVALVDISIGGMITITYAPGVGAMSGQSIVLAPTVQPGGNLLWVCTVAANTRNRYVPVSCRV